MRELRTAFLEHDPHPTLHAFYAFFRQCLNYGFDPVPLGYVRAKRMLRKKQSEGNKVICIATTRLHDTPCIAIPSRVVTHVGVLPDGRQ